MSAEVKPTERSSARRSRWWLWVIVAFLVQFAVWTAWLIFAAHNPVEEVPLATAPVKGE